MKIDFKKMVGVFTHPKTTFIDLPSDHWHLIAWLAPLYFGIARAFQPRRYESAILIFGSNIALFIFALVIGLIMIPVGCLIVKLICRLFKKRLTLKKIMNIYGYSLMPRVVVTIIGYVILFAFPNVFSENSPSPFLLSIMLLGLAGIIYTLVLFIYGLVVSPSTET